MMHIDSTSEYGAARQRLSFVLPLELELELREFASSTERSVAAVIRLALRQLLADGAGRADREEGRRR
jgi:hypothetical protein